jgi:AmiR/NasT family two-component response regulator
VTAAEAGSLRVLVADESRRQLEPVGDAVRALGHEVIALEVELGETARATQEHQPDLAIVALHEDTEHALDLIREIVDEATCPVCLLAAAPSREFLSAAARRGVFAHLDSTDPTELAGGIDIALERYRQFRDLLGAFDRRARIERAKGVLMERHGISADEAFERLRRRARDTRTPIMRVVDDVLG